MKYRNGRSQSNLGEILKEQASMTMAVAAAASDPSSFTSMKAFCMTVETRSLRASVMPENLPINRSNLNPIKLKVSK